jgi:hypothetical protein
VNGKIYFDAKFNSLPTYYNRDIVKVFLVNPKCIYVMWGISQESFDKLCEVLNCKREELRFRLLIHYKTEDKSVTSRTITLPPFTTNWFVDFLEKARDIKAELIAYNEIGNTYSLLHSAQIHLPSKKPSINVSPDWIHPSWQYYAQVTQVENEYFLTEKKESTTVDYHLKEPTEQNPFLPVTLADGSSGFMGSSGNLSSSNWNKNE